MTTPPEPAPHVRPPSVSAPSGAARALSAVMVVMMALELVRLYTGATGASWSVKALVLLMPVLALSRLRAREFFLFGVALVLTALAVLDGGIERAVFYTGLERSAFLASFMILMGLLREAAITSPSVGECGTYLTRQPSRRRFGAIFTGSHLFSVLINIGALSLLAPIIQRGVRGGSGMDVPLDEIGQVRERRQLCAALRGFAWFLVWAPTAVTQAALPVLIADIDGARLMGIGLVVAVIMLLVSWGEDTLRWLPLRRRLIASGTFPTPEPMDFPLTGFFRLSLVCGALFGLTIVFSIFGNVSIVAGVMLAAPIILVGWLLAQRWAEADALRATADRLKEIGFISVPGGIREVSSLAAAGYIGTLAAALIPADALAFLDLPSMPGWLFLTLLSVLVWAGGQIALSPITMAVFLGSVVAGLPEMPTDATLAALAIAAGTAICSTGAPFAAGMLMLARASGYSGFTIAWRWNGAYTAHVTAVLCAVYFVLTGGR